jgi:predicted ribosome quality control (RQC) complex YloA/Tae2 family protein
VHQQTIAEIVEEVREALAGRFLGKIVQLSRFSLAMDFGLREGLYLFITVEPRRPRLYLITRKIRELEKLSVPLSQFAQAMRSNLSGGNLISLLKDDSERIIRLFFSVRDETGDSHSRVLVAQLTGRSANLFVLDERGYITHALRSPVGEGQQVGERYQSPVSQAQTFAKEAPLKTGNFASPSAAADDYYTRLESEEAFTVRVKTIHDRLRKEIDQRAKLKLNLKEDLAAHGDAPQHKRLGDLLLANIANAEREGNKVRIKDYYSADEPTIEIQIEENVSLQDAAGRYFARYTKAKRAADEIVARLAQLDRELEALQQRQTEIEKISALHDEAALAALEGEKKRLPSRAGKKEASEKIPGTRRYRSSDGYEILVGRAAHNNDHLTFRVGRPNDLWLHAADYPGSHVIIRNPDRGEIPHRTIIEAAQLAGKFSQASKDSKVAVNYTLRKYLSKPKGAARGLVRMSTFRSITVKPGDSIERITT